jgi:hypothetical protein
MYEYFEEMCRLCVLLRATDFDAACTGCTVALWPDLVMGLLRPELGKHV